MNVAFPQLRVGDPVCCEALTVFPLFAESRSSVEYRLSAEALADQSVAVEEVSEGGSVPELLVVNQGDQQVLFLEGEQLVGAKQNRILNTSVLIAAHSKTKIPVTCVEQGRWHYRTRRFSSSGWHSPAEVRRAVKESVSRSVRQRGAHRSDQGKVWEQVLCMSAAYAVASPTSSLSDCFESYQGRIARFQESLPYVEGAIGMAVAVGPKLVSVDVFDKPATCRKVWARLLSGPAFDAVRADPTGHRPNREDVERLLREAANLPWEPAPAVGEGEEYRASSPRGDHASALLFDQTLVHGSLMCAG